MVLFCSGLTRPDVCPSETESRMMMVRKRHYVHSSEPLPYSEYWFLVAIKVLSIQTFSGPIQANATWIIPPLPPFQTLQWDLGFTDHFYRLLNIFIIQNIQETPISILKATYCTCCMLEGPVKSSSSLGTHLSCREQSFIRVTGT